MKAFAVRAAELGRTLPTSSSPPIVSTPFEEPATPTIKPAETVVEPSATMPVVATRSAEAAQLIAVIENPSIPVKDRVVAGDRLAEIGDPRLGVGLLPDGLPDIVWCEIPESEFVYQNDQKLTLPAFRISKYPVTYRQFQAFVDAPDGYCQVKWWAGLHADGLTQQQGGPGSQRFPHDNHPREKVSWHEAMAFCVWLTSKLSITVTLPSEQQWEKAARGTDGRVYPYGNTFDASKSNTWEAGIRSTSSVGIFTNGASPFGVMDLSGNVWEWTLTEYISANDTNFRSSGRRILRGGSWDLNQRSARAACRNSDLSDGRRSGVGFRLASPAVFP